MVTPQQKGQMALSVWPSSISPSCEAVAVRMVAAFFGDQGEQLVALASGFADADGDIGEEPGGVVQPTGGRVDAVVAEVLGDGLVEGVGLGEDVDHDVEG